MIARGAMATSMASVQRLLKGRHFEGSQHRQYRRKSGRGKNTNIEVYATDFHPKIAASIEGFSKKRTTASVHRIKYPLDICIISDFLSKMVNFDQSES
jgi:hypothetical protein